MVTLVAFWVCPRYSSLKQSDDKLTIILIYLTFLMCFLYIKDTNSQEKDM